MFFKPKEVVEIIELNTSDILEVIYYQLKRLPEDQKKQYLNEVKNRVNVLFENRLNLARFADKEWFLIMIKYPLKIFEVRYYDVCDNKMGNKVVEIEATDFYDAYLIAKTRTYKRVGYDVGSITLKGESGNFAYAVWDLCELHERFRIADQDLWWVAQ